MKTRNQFLKTVKQILFVGLLAIGVQQVSAQEAQPQGKGKMTPEQRIDMRVNKMKQNLNLSDDQVVKMKQLLTQKQSERSASSGNQQATTEERKNMMNEMAKILTPEQMAKMKEMRESQKGKGFSNDK